MLLGETINGRFSGWSSQKNLRLSGEIHRQAILLSAHPRAVHIAAAPAQNSYLTSIGHIDIPQKVSFSGAILLRCSFSDVLFPNSIPSRTGLRNGRESNSNSSVLRKR